VKNRKEDDELLSVEQCTNFILNLTVEIYKMASGCSGGELAIGGWPLAVGLKIFEK
jgi:hypothetical protein